jgi:NarL family two-component system response regulator LiaR
MTGGILIAALKWTEYRFLVVEHSIEIYGGLTAATFAALGIWLGLKLTGKRQTIVVREAPAAPEDRSSDEKKREDLHITRRELEILELIARGLSNREIAEKLFVSENTVKTHSSRVFDKLGARRRTQAVRWQGIRPSRPLCWRRTICRLCVSEESKLRLQPSPSITISAVAEEIQCSGSIRRIERRIRLATRILPSSL